MIEIRRALTDAMQRLSPLTPDARADTETLLSHVLGKNRAYLYAHPEKTLSASHAAAFEQLVLARIKGMPVAYLLGYRDFWSLSLKVTPDTLIPRHETERLVELALELLPEQTPKRILDLGTGSGAIALALAIERPHWEIDAVDYSLDALAVAQDNAKTHHIHNVRFIHSNWFAALGNTRYHAILANPPYIHPNDPHLKQGDLRFEPQSALVSGQDGLADLQYIILHSKEYLLPEGLLLLEHGFEQKNQINAILNGLNYKNIHCWQDFLGQDRVSGAWLSDSEITG